MSATDSERRAILEALGAYQKRGSVSDNIYDLAYAVDSESDRGLVVMLGSIIEDMLLERILGTFVELTDWEKKELTRAGGILNNFNHRVVLAYSLGIIDQPTADHLRTMKAMRNACAHSRLPISFDTPELCSAVSLFFAGDGVATMKNPPAGAALAMRVFFLMAFVMLSGFLKEQDKETAIRDARALMDEAVKVAKSVTAELQASREKSKSQ
ncbi:MAG: hypothetical protein KDE32_02015 [Novosphingobium sp.]|nr:hypothetical protein [Novosphingobium sp.]